MSSWPATGGGWTGRAERLLGSRNGSTGTVRADGNGGRLSRHGAAAPTLVPPPVAGRRPPRCRWPSAATIVLAVLCDIFFTVLFPASGRGPIRKPLSRLTWACFRGTAGNSSPITGARPRGGRVCRRLRWRGSRGGDVPGRLWRRCCTRPGSNARRVRRCSHLMHKAAARPRPPAGPGPAAGHGPPFRPVPSQAAQGTRPATQRESGQRPWSSLNSL